MNGRSLDGKHVVVFGGTGSLGQRLFRRLLTGEMGSPKRLVVFSRDEAKQHYMRLDIRHELAATDDVIYRARADEAQFVIGDVRNYDDVKRAVDGADVIFHAAALKQVPTCEYFAEAAVDTNVYGAINLRRAVNQSPGRQRLIVGISTDKACKPVNLMGMTKAVQERVLIQANLDSPDNTFVNVRYGNVMASRGSAIPFFIDLVRRGRPIPITDDRMTRFLMSLDQSVDLIFNAVRYANPGETYLPIVPTAKVTDIAVAVAGREDYPLEHTGIRPGEKLHEILVSEEEIPRTRCRGENFVIQPILPELVIEDGSVAADFGGGEYTSAIGTLGLPALTELLERHKLTAASARVADEFR